MSIPQPPPQTWSAASPPYQPNYTYTPPNYWETQRAGKIDNTKTGLLLLMIGSLLSWIPFVGAVGGLIILIGAIFIIIGREAFGHEHERNVIVSIVMFVIGIGIFAAGFIAIFFAAFSNAINNPGSTMIEPSWYTVLILVAGAVWGIAEVLFTYSLQSGNGRTLLWSAFIIGIVTSALNSFLVVPTLTATRGFFFNSGTYFLTGLLAAPSAVVYGIAFYMGRERIERKEIPTLTPHPGSNI